MIRQGSHDPTLVDSDMPKVAAPPDSAALQVSGDAASEVRVGSEEFLRLLNDDLAGEWGEVIRYTYQSSRALRRKGGEMWVLLQGDIQDELRHIATLAEAIHDLGGKPTQTPHQLDEAGHPEATFYHDMQREFERMTRYIRRARQAECLGFLALRQKLEEMAADEAGHARQLQRLAEKGRGGAEGLRGRGVAVGREAE